MRAVPEPRISSANSSGAVRAKSTQSAPDSRIFQRNRAPNAAPRAGDESDFVFQLHNSYTLRIRSFPLRYRFVNAPHQARQNIAGAEFVKLVRAIRNHVLHGLRPTHRIGHLLAQGALLNLRRKWPRARLCFDKPEFAHLEKARRQ